MKLPKTSKGYLRLLVMIAKDDISSLRKPTAEEVRLVGNIRADIQNNLGEPEAREILEKHQIEWRG